MIRNMVHNWWAFVLQGVLAIGVGIAAFVVPGPTLAAFIALFAAYAIVTGVFEIAGGFSMANGPKWSLVVGGVLGVAVGLIAVLQPEATAVTVTVLVAIYSIATGVARTAAAYALRNVSQTWTLGLSGVLSVIFGVLLIAAPEAGVLTLIWLVGFYATLWGVSTIAFGLRLRGIGEDVSTIEQALTGEQTAAPSR
jgi:uncharacterized membrane protein HdeD (DUF308 family)